MRQMRIHLNRIAKLANIFASVTALRIPLKPTYQLWQKYYSLHEKGPIGLINGTFKFVFSHNENTQVSDFVNPVKLPAIQCAYTNNHE